MTRTVVTAAITLLLVVSVGCQSTDQGRSQRLPRRSGAYSDPAQPVNLPETAMVRASTDEVDLVEQVAAHRRAYRQSLELLIQNYAAVGNNMKLNWAQEELRSLDRIPQYRYIIDAEVLPPDLRATARIPEADELYLEATGVQKRAEPLPLLKDDELLRVALDRYSQLIREYPTSDKIDDAAYKMAGIHEHFRDYTIALLYYQRAYQWDAETPYPARFKAAFILDKKLRRRDEALELYQEAVIKEAQYDEWKAFAEQRIESLTKSDSEPQ